MSAIARQLRYEATLEPCGNCGDLLPPNETVWLTCDNCKAVVGPCCAEAVGELIICKGCDDPELTEELWAAELAEEKYELYGEVV